MRAILSIIILLGISFCYSRSEKKDYALFLQEVIAKKNDYKRLYVNADVSAKDSIITVARAYLINTISNDIFPYWYGTKWDFNGTTRTPQQGKIACGYFVTTILEDVGFKIPRVKWAQSASEVFIKKLAPNNIKRFSNRPIAEIENYLLTTGDGLYVVGLDIHVGFIIVKNKSINFVHSNYYKPEIGVMKEDINSKNPFKDSNYRIIGKLMSDEMVLNWINNIAYD
ncbi:MAG: hypothetical protein WCO54_12050, partial [Bacteroidota bacterium]